MKSRQLLNLTVFFFVLCSCKTKEAVTHNDVRTEYITTLKPYFIPVETASAKAMLECSKEGMVLLTRLNIETSKNARMSLMIDSLNMISVEAIVERDTLYLPSDTIKITKDVLRTAIEYRDKPLTGWQKLKQEAGGIALGGCVALIGILIVFLYKKIF